MSLVAENFVPQAGQMRWGSVFMDLAALPRRLRLCDEHGFPRQAVAARLGNQVPGSEPLAAAISTERYETGGQNHFSGSRSAS
jgi:hypothetical protein